MVATLPFPIRSSQVALRPAEGRPTRARELPTAATGEMDAQEIARLEAAIAGDRAALTELTEQYRRIVAAGVRRWLAPTTDADLEDHIQSVFAKLPVSIRSFDFRRRTKFSTWFYAFLRHYCLDVRKRRRLRLVSIQQPEEDAPERALPSTARAPWQESQQSELRALLHEAVGSLPRAERLVFELREIDGADYAEIATRLGIAEGTAKGRLYRAKESLRVRLRPYLRDGSTLRRTDWMKSA